MKNTHPNNPGHTLTLPIGPLRYRFEAHDDWGQGILQSISEHIACGDITDQRCDRIIHLHHWINHDQMSEAPIPESLAQLLPDGETDKIWRCTDNLINTFWTSSTSRQTLWTRAASVHVGKLRFHLPWNLIIGDCIALGGGLVHAGLVSHGENGLLFLAPPGGGKTTTLKTAPHGWTTLSDDAALIWPTDNGNWLASPLPAWGNLTNPDHAWLYPQVRLDRHCRLKSLLHLEKGSQVHLKKIAPSEMVPALYRALCEYPVTIMAEAVQHETLFRATAKASRKLICWQLALPLNGDIWPLLSKEAA